MAVAGAVLDLTLNLALLSVPLCYFNPVSQLKIMCPGVWPTGPSWVASSFFFFLRFYLFMRDTEREAETYAEGEAGSLQGARCGTRSQDHGTSPEPKADAQPLSHPSIFFGLSVCTCGMGRAIPSSLVGSQDWRPSRVSGK